MEGTEESVLIFNEQQKRVVQKLVEDNDFNKLIRALGLFNDEEVQVMLLDKNEIADLQGAALYSLGKILTRSKKMNAKEKEIADKFDIQKNIQKAIYCYTKSLMCGYGPAANKLFNIYYNSKDGFQDYEKAIQMAQIGVELFNTASYYNMGKLYYEGKAVKRNCNVARKYFEISFMENGKLGGYELGMIYERGWGVGANQSTAFDCFYSAAECGDILATFKIGAILSGFYEDKYTAVRPKPKEAISFFEEYLKHCSPNKRTNAVTSIGKIEHKSENIRERADGIKKLVREAKKGDEFAMSYLTEQTSYGKELSMPKTIDLSVLDI